MKREGTKFRDDNGNEILEGDILGRTGSEDKRMVVKWKEEDPIEEAGWWINDPSCCRVCAEGRGLSLPLGLWLNEAIEKDDQVLVIGNIYQDQDLIDEVKA